MKKDKKEVDKIFIELNCNQCNYKWYSRTKIPKQCPRCKRYDYKEESKDKGEESTYEESIRWEKEKLK